MEVRSMTREFKVTNLENRTPRSRTSCNLSYFHSIGFRIEQSPPSFLPFLAFHEIARKGEFGNVNLWKSAAPELAYPGRVRMTMRVVLGGCHLPSDTWHGIRCSRSGFSFLTCYRNMLLGPHEGPWQIVRCLPNEPAREESDPTKRIAFSSGNDVAIWQVRTSTVNILGSRTATCRPYSTHVGRGQWRKELGTQDDLVPE